MYAFRFWGSALPVLSSFACTLLRHWGYFVRARHKDRLGKQRVQRAPLSRAGQASKSPPVVPRCHGLAEPPLSPRCQTGRMRTRDPLRTYPVCKKSVRLRAFCGHVISLQAFQTQVACIGVTTRAPAKPVRISFVFWTRSSGPPEDRSGWQSDLGLLSKSRHSTGDPTRPYRQA